MESHFKVIVSAVTQLLRPLVRILLHYGVSVGSLTEIIRRVYVEIAQQDFTVDGRKQTDSRISLLTGLNRKEVARLQQLPSPEASDVDERYNRATRVVTGWLRDQRFHTKAGRPAALPFEGRNSFSELVKKYSGGVPPRAVKDELLRVKAIELSRDKHLKLMSRGYIPQLGEADKLQILGTDTAQFIRTIEHNLNCKPGDAHFQRKVSYDAVPIEHAVAFRKYSAKLSQEVLEKLDRWLAKRDRDTNPKIKGTDSMLMGLGIYLIEEQFTEKNAQPKKQETPEVSS